MSDLPAVSVVIPVWNAESHLPDLLPCLLDQRGVVVSEILLLDSMSTDRTASIASSHDRVRVLPEPDFSHGGTRNRGIGMAREELVLLMTQDALPDHDSCFAELVAALNEDSAAYAFARQIPYPGTNPMECYYLAQKFPKGGKTVYHSGGEPVRSPEESFSSNVCAILKKSVWQNHPFREDLMMGEDQEVSCRLQEAGYSVIYAGNAVVRHSHNYPLMSLFRRYFDSVVALTQIFPDRNLNSNAASGVSFLKGEMLFLLRHHPLWLLYTPFYLGAKTLATLLAHRAESLPSSLRTWCSMNRGYWDRVKTS